MVERTAYSVKAAAKLLGYSTDALYKAFNTGQGTLAEALSGRWQRDNRTRKVMVYLDDETILSARRHQTDQPEAPPPLPTSSADHRLIVSLEDRIADRDAQIADLRTRLERAETTMTQERERAERATMAERERADRIAGEAAAERGRLLAMLEEAQRRQPEPAPSFLARLFGRR